MLLEGFYGKEGFLILSASPVGRQLLPPEVEPLSYKMTCPARKAADEHSSVVDPDPCLVLSIDGVECAGGWSLQYM